MKRGKTFLTYEYESMYESSAESIVRMLLLSFSHRVIFATLILRMRFVGNIGKFLAYRSNENVEASGESMCSLNFTHRINSRQFTIVHHARFNITYSGYKMYLRILVFFNGAFFFFFLIKFYTFYSNFSVI